MSDWRSIVAKYQSADPRRAVTQLVTTGVPLGVAAWLMYWSLSYSYWLTLALAVPSAGLLVRTFIIMHDCAHGSFLPRRWANEIVGYITGVLTFTPFSLWRHLHAVHHATSGDLDRRGTGDITTLTVREYQALSRWKRLQYRLYRNPIVLLGFGPLYLMIGQRLPKRTRATGSAQNRSVWTANLGIAACFVGAGLLIGFGPVLWIWMPALYLAGMAGIWLFYVQHQFDETYWEPHARWDYPAAAVRGSSYLKLPRVFQWFTGNIGLHHVHHLGPRIPNYNLQRCFDENPIFHHAHIVTFRRSLHLLRLALWDETRKRMVSFSELGRPEWQSVLG
jgi:omega-6 fatty acid desaturase (delta-12 desaturase)